MNTSTRSSEIRSRVGTGLIYFLTIVLFGSAATKLIPIPKVSAGMAAMGFSGINLTLIAVLEIASAILFLYPRTRAFGLLMVSAYLGGAMATHLGHNQPLFPPGIVLALFWLAAWLRHPEMIRGVRPTSS